MKIDRIVQGVSLPIILAGSLLVFAESKPVGAQQASVEAEDTKCVWWVWSFYLKCEEEQQ